MKKLLALLVAIMMMSSLFVGLAAAEEPITITFWCSWEDAWRDALKGLVEQWEAQNPGVHVEFVYAGSYSESNQSLLAAHAATLSAPNGEVYVPTVQQTVGTNIPTFAANGVIYPLDEYIAANGDDMSVFASGMLKAYQYQGEQYGLPGCISLVPSIFYNKTFAEQEGIEFPTSWDEFDAFLRKATIKDEQGNTVRYGASFSGWGIDYVTPILRAFGVQPFTDEEETQSGFDCPEIREFATKMQGWAKEGLISWAFGSGASTNMRQSFLDGKTFCVWHTCALYDLYSKGLAAKGWEIGAAFPPTGAKQVAGLGGSGFTLMKLASPEQREWGYKLIRFLTDTACNMVIIQNTGYLPVTKTCLESEECAEWLKANPELVHLYDHLDELVASPSSPAWADIGTKVTDNFGRIIVEGEDVEATLQFMFDEIQEILEDM